MNKTNPVISIRIIAADNELVTAPRNAPPQIVAMISGWTGTPIA